MICLRKKRKKWISWFFGWKLGGFDIFRGQFLKIFKKNPKNLTSPVNIKCFNLKNHHQLKKKILSTKKWRQIYSSSGPTGPPPGTQRVKFTELYPIMFLISTYQCTKPLLFGRSYGILCLSFVNPRCFFDLTSWC